MRAQLGAKNNRSLLMGVQAGRLRNGAVFVQEVRLEATSERSPTS